jgi:hypothetical protein
MVFVSLKKKILPLIEIDEMLQSQIFWTGLKFFFNNSILTLLNLMSHIGTKSDIQVVFVAQYFHSIGFTTADAG